MNNGYKGEGIVKKNIELFETIVSDPQSLILVDIRNRWRTIVGGNDKAWEDRHITLIEDEKARKFMADIAATLLLNSREKTFQSQSS